MGRRTTQILGSQVANALPRGGRMLYLGDAAMGAAGGAGLRQQLPKFRELARVPGPQWAHGSDEVLLVLEKL